VSHPDRRTVYQKPASGCCFPKGFVVQTVGADYDGGGNGPERRGQRLAASGDDVAEGYLRDPRFDQGHADRPRRAAGAQEHGPTPLRREARLRQGAGEAGDVGVVAVETPLPVDDRVDGACLLGQRVQLVEVGDHRLLVGDRHVRAQEVVGAQAAHPLL
jgi:hypothetical protein